MSDKEQLRKEFDDFLKVNSGDMGNQSAKNKVFDFLCSKLSPLPVEKQQSEDEVCRLNGLTEESLTTMINAQNIINSLAELTHGLACGRVKTSNDIAFRNACDQFESLKSHYRTDPIIKP